MRNTHAPVMATVSFSGAAWLVTAMARRLDCLLLVAGANGLKPHTPRAPEAALAARSALPLLLRVACLWC
jgi:hypothetical protein